MSLPIRSILKELFQKDKLQFSSEIFECKRIFLKNFKNMMAIFTFMLVTFLQVSKSGWPALVLVDSGQKSEIIEGCRLRYGY